MGEPAYTVTETLHRGERVVLHRALRRADRCPVLLKVLGPRPTEPRDLERLRNELETGRALEGRGIVRPLAIDTHEGKPALVLEDFNAAPLERLLGRPMELGRFLDLACAITTALALLHQAGVVHKNVKPENILVHLDTGEVRLIDLGLSARISRGLQPNRYPELIEGTLPYMSPEQTGRMNRAVDRRSDLYSLGITFFAMLTGRLPFAAHDPLEWVHAHVARRAPSPRTIVPEIPEPLAAIVMRLLDKMPEARYQTARGLGHDLERARAAWIAAGRIEPFPLGEMDLPDRLQLPQRLYGRAAQLAALLKPLEAMLATGRPALALVSGSAGVGKSSLVHELLRSIEGARGFFLSGKFDQYKRNIPYATLSQAFRGLFQELLGGSEERLTAWRARLSAALGASGRLIADVIPELELVLGPQPPVAPLPPLEAEQRFRLVFHAFITAFAGPEHPMVLFVDDLQWADVASLKLLQHVLTTPDTCHLLVLGAYRDNEVEPDHPLLAMLRQIRVGGVRVDEIVLEALSTEDLSALMADTVHRPPHEVRPLAQLLHAKTGGNPFFVIQFLTELADEGLLAFDGGARRWQWDLPQIRDKHYTDNVVAFMVGQLQRLPAPAREALCLAACAGNVSDVRTLATVRGTSEEAMRRDLRPTIEAGLLISGPGTFQFAHDRVQQAAYSLLPEEERRRIHLRIGRVLLEITPPAAVEERVFEIVNQLNLGREGLVTPEERRRLAELDLLAGRKAMAAAAYATAASHFATGASLLPPDAWETLYALAFPLQLERARSEFIAGNVDEAERQLDVAREHARDARDAAAVASAEIYLRTVLGQMDRAVGVALVWLRRHAGISLSAHPTWEEVLAKQDALRRAMGERASEALLDLPRLEDPELLTVMDVLVAPMPPALFSDANMLASLAFTAAELSVRHGNSDASASAYLVVAMVLAHRFGEYREAFGFAKLGRDLVEKRNLVSYRAKVYLDFVLIHQWTHPLRNSREILQHAFDSAVEVGNLPIACYVCNNRISLLLALGTPLSEVQRECEASLAFVRRARYGLVEAIITSQLRLVLNLRGATDGFSTFDGGGFEERAFLERLEANPGSMAIALCWHFIRKLQARFISGDYEEALAASRRAEELLWTSTSFLEVPEFHFYHSLTLAAIHDQRGPEERAAIVAALTTERDRLGVWAENCPQNFRHKHALVAAELARIQGDELQAMQRYEQAIRGAHDEGFVQNEALAYELAARAYRARDFGAVADLYLREARLRYLSWGAEAKVSQLDRLCPRLKEPRLLITSEILAVPVAQLELIAVVKASQAISKEVAWDSLARRLLEVSLEQGGADRGCLVLVEEGELVVAAEATADERGPRTELLHGVPLEGSGLVPASIVQFVRRSQELVVLDDATLGGSFSNDEYIITRRPRSLLCLPILRQTEVCAVLYLENDLVSGAFTVERLTVLALIAAQGAIALDNAQLLAKEQAARAAAEAAERRASFLAEAGALLSESLDYDATFARLARLCVRSLASWCVIDIVEGREIRRIAGALADPSKEAVLATLKQQYPPRRDSGHPAAVVLRTGQPLLIPELPDEVLRSMCDDDEHSRLIRELGTVTGLAVPLVARGATLGVLTLGSDTPGRRYGRADLELAEEVAHRAASALDNAQLYRASQEAVRARSEFLTVASHELNTPVTSLMLTVQSLRRAAPSGRPIEPQVMERLLDLTVRQGARLTKLVGDLLDVSRLDAGRSSLDLKAVELEALVREVVERFEPDLARSRCAVSISVKDDARPAGLWDRSRIDRVITNLLANAIKFGAGKPIELSLGSESGVAWLAVRDHGIGVDPAQRSRIFGCFERAVSERHYGGLGLGLYISRRIMEEHGGSIRCEGTPGAGATFIIDLPCGQPPPSDARAREAKE